VCLLNVSSRSSNTSNLLQQTLDADSILIASMQPHHAQLKYCSNVTLPLSV
jgi:hypothetical protein